MSEAVIEAASGGVAAVISTTTMYPLEIAKTKLVTRIGDKETTFTVLAKVLKEEGVLGLYRGLQVKNAQAVVQSTVYFYVYSFLKSLTKSKGANMSMTTNLGIGYLAGVANLAVVLPIEVVSTRLQVADKSVTAAQVIKRVMSESGPAGFYKGFLASILLCVNPAINIMVFDQLKVRLLEYLRARSGNRNIASLTAFQAFVVGVIAKIVATLITYPHIRAKTVLQAKEKKRSVGAHDAVALEADCPDTTLGIMRFIVAREGVFGLFRGIGPQLFRAVLVSALMFTAKERIDNYIRLTIAGSAAKKA